MSFSFFSDSQSTDVSDVSDVSFTSDVTYISDTTIETDSENEFLSLCKKRSRENFTYSSN